MHCFQQCLLFDESRLQSHNNFYTLDKVAKKSKKLKRSLLPALLGLSSIAIVGALIYFAVSFKNSTYEQTGFITCNEQNTSCEESKHIHADIAVSICGQSIQFPKEKGDTQKQHTHKERNKIHWHARITVDPITRQYLDSSPRILYAFFEQMNTPIPTTCNGKPATTQIFVNNSPQTINYVWDDGDAIRVIVD